MAVALAAYAPAAPAESVLRFVETGGASGSVATSAPEPAAPGLELNASQFRFVESIEAPAAPEATELPFSGLIATQNFASPTTESLAAAPQTTAAANRPVELPTATELFSAAAQAQPNTFTPRIATAIEYVPAPAPQLPEAQPVRTRARRHRPSHRRAASCLPRRRSRSGICRHWIMAPRCGKCGRRRPRELQCIQLLRLLQRASSRGSCRRRRRRCFRSRRRSRWQLMPRPRFRRWSGWKFPSRWKGRRFGHRSSRRQPMRVASAVAIAGPRAAEQLAPAALAEASQTKLPFAYEPVALADENTASITASGPTSDGAQRFRFSGTTDRTPAMLIHGMEPAAADNLAEPAVMPELASAPCGCNPGQFCQNGCPYLPGQSGTRYLCGVDCGRCGVAVLLDVERCPVHPLVAVRPGRICRPAPPGSR